MRISSRIWVWRWYQGCGHAAPADHHGSMAADSARPASVASLLAAPARRRMLQVSFARRPSACGRGHQHGAPAASRSSQRPPAHAQRQKAAYRARRQRQRPGLQAGRVAKSRPRPAATSRIQAPTSTFQLSSRRTCPRHPRAKGWFCRRMDITSHPNIVTHQIVAMIGGNLVASSADHDHQAHGWPAAKASTNFRQLALPGGRGCLGSRPRDGSKGWGGG